MKWRRYGSLFNSFGDIGLLLIGHALITVGEGVCEVKFACFHSKAIYTVNLAILHLAAVNKWDD